MRVLLFLLSAVSLSVLPACRAPHSSSSNGIAFVRGVTSPSESPASLKFRDAQARTAPVSIREERAELKPGRVTIFQNRDYSPAEREYLLSAHNPTYFLATHNSKFNPSIYEEATGSEILDAEKAEVKFQASVKFPLWQNVVGNATDLYFGYTQLAFWQVFTNSEALSRPFREVNYEPELFFRHYTDIDLPWGGKLEGLDVGIAHQSNGQTRELSRSWNRILARAAADFGDLALVGRMWYRIPESEEDDENPFEYRYLGYGDLRAVWTPDEHIVSAMVRPATERVSFELSWSYPIGNQVRFYAQWYNGFAENLYEYNVRSNRIGFGFSITDWLIGDD